MAAFFQLKHIPAVTDLTPPLLNELYELLRLPHDGSERKHKRRLLMWMQANAKAIQVLEGEHVVSKQGWRNLIRDSESARLWNPRAVAEAEAKAASPSLALRPRVQLAPEHVTPMTPEPSQQRKQDTPQSDDAAALIHLAANTAPNLRQRFMHVVDQFEAGSYGVALQMVQSAIGVMVEFVVAREACDAKPEDGRQE
ncbi:hypothetical protein CLAFUW4_14830 [Fulvia fulva]|nr:hypothetical protein CLAFUR0_14823 [Fulvia fulva]WPV23022.1 hypothetical protein CLAFUW4_14830 [Fulvia fulva]WPV37937.1 hypothetical protein CLAFUW7_14831 [Fulvia fulva]